MRPGHPRAPRHRRLGHLLALGLFLTTLALWLTVTATRPFLMDRDWVAFDRAGWRGLAGHWESVYTASAGETWQYLYPPIAIVLSLPLGMLPYHPSYVLSVAMVLGGIWWSCRRLRPLVDAEPGRYEVFCAVVLCVPTTLQVLITAQYSWLYLLALSGLAAHWSNGDERRAGHFLALLALKPNLGLFVIPLLVLRRRGATVRSALRAVAFLVAVTLPFSLFAWKQFFIAVRGVAQRQERGEAPIAKQTTILSFLRVLSGHMDGSVLTWVLWSLLAAVLCALVAWAWRVGGEQASDLRLVGMTALAIVSLSPRLYFYDGLVAVIPAAHWYLRRADYASRRLRRLEGLCIAGIVVVTFAFFPRPGVGTAFGPLAGCWLALEAADIIVARRRSSAQPSAPESDLALAR